MNNTIIPLYMNVEPNTPEQGYYTATIPLIYEKETVTVKGTARSEGKAVGFALEKVAEIYKKEGIKGINNV